MRVVVQRVSEASVRIEGKIKSSIGPGLLVFVGIEEADDAGRCGMVSLLKFADCGSCLTMMV